MGKDRESMLTKTLKMFGASRGDKMAGAKHIANTGPIDTSQLSGEDWEKMYRAYTRAHEASGEVVVGFEDFRSSVERNIPQVNKLSRFFRK